MTSTRTSAATCLCVCLTGNWPATTIIRSEKYCRKLRSRTIRHCSLVTSVLANPQRYAVGCQCSQCSKSDFSASVLVRALCLCEHLACVISLCSSASLCIQQAYTHSRASSLHQPHVPPQLRFSPHSHHNISSQLIKPALNTCYKYDHRRLRLPAHAEVPLLRA